MFKRLPTLRKGLVGLGLAAVATLGLAAAPAPAAHADGNRVSFGFGVQFNSHDRYRSHHRPYYRPYRYRPYSYETKTVYRNYAPPVYYQPAPVTVIKRSYRSPRTYCPPPRPFYRPSKVVRVVEQPRRGKGKGHGKNKGKGKGKGKKH
ncbi:MAG: hypothetical protein AAGB29_11265 [Planctomycetota bacterium]